MSTEKREPEAREGTKERASICQPCFALDRNRLSISLHALTHTHTRPKLLFQQTKTHDYFKRPCSMLPHCYWTKKGAFAQILTGSLSLLRKNTEQSSSGFDLPSIVFVIKWGWTKWKKWKISQSIMAEDNVRWCFFNSLLQILSDVIWVLHTILKYIIKYKLLLIMPDYEMILVENLVLKNTKLFKASKVICL